MEAGQGRISGPREFASDKGSPVLEIGHAARIEPPCQLVNWPDARKYLHGRLDGAAGDGPHVHFLVSRAESRS